MSEKRQKGLERFPALFLKPDRHSDIYGWWVTALKALT